MKSLFDYENKFMQALMAVGDLIILNILFILFSLPIVTMGAAQAGLYTGVRVITDKEDDSSPAAGFFRGFKTGFFKITLMWIPFLFLIAASLWACFGAPNTWIKVVATIGFCIVAIYWMLIVVFHSRFDCTPFQLLKNSTLLLLAHPLRVIPAAFFCWLTVLFILFDFYSFLAMGVMVLTLFISLSHLLSYALLHKPFQELVQMANERLNPTEEEPPSEEAAEEDANETTED